MKAAVAAVLATVLTTACTGVEVITAQEQAENACNGWSAAIEGGSSPEETQAGILRAANAARRAADLDDAYTVLADSLEGLHTAAVGGDVEGLMAASDSAFDECWNIMDSDDEVRRIMEEELGK